MGDLLSFELACKTVVNKETGEEQAGEASCRRRLPVAGALAVLRRHDSRALPSPQWDPGHATCQHLAASSG